MMSDGETAVQRGARRFGVTAVQHGFITQDQLLKALSAQVMDNLEGRPHRLIGQILLDHEAITREQIEEVLQTLG